MINVRAIANAAIQTVNPDITGQLYSSTGYTINANYKQVPTYPTVGVDVQLQVQAVRAKDLEHVANLNAETLLRNVRMWGNTQGVVRPDAKGGDLLRFAQVPTGTVQTWKVVAVLETWPAWCSLIVQLQTDTGAPS